MHFVGILRILPASIKSAIAYLTRLILKPLKLAIDDIATVVPSMSFNTSSTCCCSSGVVVIVTVALFILLYM